jgi:hypothetical protein
MPESALTSHQRAHVLTGAGLWSSQARLGRSGRNTCLRQILVNLPARSQVPLGEVVVSKTENDGAGRAKRWVEPAEIQSSAFILHFP